MNPVNNLHVKPESAKMIEINQHFNTWETPVWSEFFLCLKKHK